MQNDAYYRLEHHTTFGGLHIMEIDEIKTSYKLVSREYQSQNSVIRVGKAVFGSLDIPVIAGPCAVESYEQLLEIGKGVRQAGASMLRGGAYKPRTSPYSFQGLEREGLEFLKAVGQEVGLPTISEVTDPRAVELMMEYVDVLQIGARNMQNFALLKEVSKTSMPILLKRGMSATIEEWLMAAEYIMVGGNEKIVLCERGIRTFETFTRNTLDLNAVAVIKQVSHLPIIVDPSHGTGDWQLVNPLSRASIAVGADGLLIEVHNNPPEAVSDGPQSLTPKNFALLMSDLATIGEILGRQVSKEKR